MAQYPLLQTKLHIPPIRANLVSRPRLIERLNAGLDQNGFQENLGSGLRLTLICAPAGFGKTTLMSEWVGHPRLDAKKGSPHARRIAWLSLDEGDNDPARFLAYLIAALRTIEAGIGKEVLSALHSPQPPPAEVVLTSLINEITAIPARIFLFLDDYHLIEAQPIHDALAFLLEHLPPQMHIVIATREDPHLPLARLRARGQLTEVRASDLRFSSSEAAEFLNRAMGLDLSAEDITALETRTEGWIAGLQLAAISMQGRRGASDLVRAFSGSHRYVLDYLVEEVLGQQPPDIQTFLLQTSVLDQLAGPLCDAVRTGGTEMYTGQEILETLDRANLFIVPLDNERRWYRYHHLFADLLRQRLNQTQPEQIPMLHLRASQWYEQNGFTDEAIEHSLRGQDTEQAASLIEAQADAVWDRGEHAQLWNWLARLPGDVISRRPFLCLFHAWFLFAKGPRDDAERYLQVAEQALAPGTEPGPKPVLSEQNPLSDSDRQKLGGRAAAIRAFMASFQGDILAIIKHARRALEYLPEQDLSWRSSAALALGDALGFRGDMAAAYQARLEAAEASAAAGSSVFSTLAYIKVAITLREQGQLRQTIEVCQRQIQLAGEGGLARGSLAGCLRAIWGEVLAELGDLEGALALAQSGVELAEGGADWSLFSWSCLCLIRVLFSAGSMAGTQEVIDKIQAVAQEVVLPPWIMSQVKAWQARLWVADNELEKASQWARERGWSAAGEPQSLQELDFFALDEHVMLARVLIAQDGWAEATRLLSRLLEAAKAGGRNSKAIEILMLKALAFQAGGDTSQALDSLASAITLAAPGGFVRIFVDEGPPMARLLYQASERAIAPEYTRWLLAAFPVTTKAPEPEKSQVVESELVEPLSERELEVLELVAQGLTNREIASRLFLSLNTIKAHTRNIYGKLGVHSRTQAIARSQALGILPTT